MSRLREKLYKEYKLEELGYDFLGYTFDFKRDLSTHHILPKNSGGKTEKKNLCILNRYTSHNYIHLIEDYDKKVFLQISSHLLKQVSIGKIDIDEIRKIRELLEFFEYKYRNEATRNGERLIKPEFKEKRIILKEEL